MTKQSELYSCDQCGKAFVLSEMQLRWRHTVISPPRSQSWKLHGHLLIPGLSATAYVSKCLP